MASLSVSPSTALIDEPVHIVVNNLKKWQPVTLCASLAERNIEYVSYAHYTADQNGTIDVCKQPSISGTYFGIEPMGLLWSMVLADGQRRGSRLVKKDVQTPYKVNIAVRDGHVTCKSPQEVTLQSEELLAVTQIERWYMKPGVRRIPVRDGRVRGMLFLPPGKDIYMTKQIHSVTKYVV